MERDAGIILDVRSFDGLVGFAVTGDREGGSVDSLKIIGCGGRRLDFHDCERTVRRDLVAVFAGDFQSGAVFDISGGDLSSGVGVFRCFDDKESGVAGDMGGLVASGAEFAGDGDFRFVFRDKEVKITGVPLRVEVDELRVVALAVPDHSACVGGGPVVAEGAAHGEEIGSFVVFPCLEIGTDFSVVFRHQFVDRVFDADLRMGYVVEFQHGFNVLFRVEGRVEKDDVEVLVSAELVLSADEFDGIVGEIGSDRLHHLFQF